MTAEKPMNLRCFVAGSTTAIFLAVKKFLLIINKSNNIRFRFWKYWMVINLCKFKVEFEVRIFKKKKKLQRMGHKSDNFYDIKKPVCIL